MLMKPIESVAPTAPSRSFFAGIGRALALASLAGFAGFALGYAASAAASTSADPELTVLLRFMALTKLAMALGAAVLVDWRLRYPASSGVAAAYLIAICVMAAVPGLIWSMAYMIPAAAAFHGAMLLALLTALQDGKLRRRR